MSRFHTIQLSQQRQQDLFSSFQQASHVANSVFSGQRVDATHVTVDLLEVYAGQHSPLTEAVISAGGTAIRFTKEDGDLSTPAGRRKLWQVIDQHQPRNIFVAPECGPWNGWSHLNSYKSLAMFDYIQYRREQELIHLKLCRDLCAYQVRHGRHFHLEQPLGSLLTSQEDFSFIRAHARQAKMDMCAFGLKIPRTNLFLRKRSQLWTTDEHVFETFHDKKCPQDHEHQQIAGSISVPPSHSNVDASRCSSQNLSRFCATYCKGFVQQLAKCFMSVQHALVHQTKRSIVDDENPPKRGRFAEGLHKRRRFVNAQPVESSSQSSIAVPPDSLWYEAFRMATLNTARVGNTKHDGQSDLCQLVQGLLSDDYQVRCVFSCRGTDRFQVPIGAPSSHEMPWRKTICMHRYNGTVHEFPFEDWHSLTRAKRIRTCMPSKLTLSIFAQKISDGLSGHPPPQAEMSPMHDSPPGEIRDSSAPVTSLVSSRAQLHDQPKICEGWAPPPVPLHGPAFRSLSADEKNQLVKLHKNLGHPDPAVLSRHLQMQGSPPHVIAGVQDYVCDSCVESKKPFHQRPAKLHEPKEFNQMLGMDAFYWSGRGQFQCYVLHVHDEASGFHLARRLDGRNLDHAIPAFQSMWLSWAGAPDSIYLDPAGEFCADRWSSFLQSQNISVFMSAEVWQKGRIERHGHILKEMLSRMDTDVPFQDIQQFDDALLMCCQSKNSLTRSHGYSPEQLVLGKSTKLPASLMSDDQASSHEMAIGTDLESENFRQKLELRTRARQAYVLADNSDAMRRALLRKSCPHRGVFHPGQLVLYWVKRSKPNRNEAGRWHGPGKVVAQEGSSVVWISHLNRLIRSAPECVRPASLREWQNSQIVGAVSPHSPEAPIGPHEPLNSMPLTGPSNSEIVQPPNLEFPDSVVPSPSTPGAVSIGNGSLSTGDQPESETAPLPAEVPLNETLPIDPPLELGSNEVDFNAPVNVPVPVEEFEEDHQDGMLTQVVPLEDKDDFSDSDLQTFDVLYAGDETSQVCLAEDNLPIIDEPLSCEAYQCYVLEIPMSATDVFNWYHENNPTEMACVASASQRSHAEVHVRNLTSKEKLLFDAAKDQELSCWLSTNSLRPILRKQLNPEQILQSRWVLTWKQVEADGNQPAHKKAKARLVVLGYQDPKLTSVARDAPTLTRDGRHTILQTIASYSWDLTSFDIKTAFLRGKADDNNPLAMNPPIELRRKLQLSEDQVCALVGNAYGRVDAPLLFYRELTKNLQELNFRVHPMEPCIFLLESTVQGKRKLHGIIGTHVDDGIGGGDEYFHTQLMKLQTKLPFGSFKQRKFTFCGIQLEQTPDQSILASQADYIHKIMAIDVGKTRREQSNAPANDAEISKLRGLIGSLQYAVTHTRPDLAARLGDIQVQMAQPKVETLLACNKVLREAQQTSNVKICFRHISPDLVTHVSFGDASFASPKQLASFQGTLICATTPALDQNLEAPISPLSWSSKKIARVVRSTLSAEAYSMSRSVDRLSWLRLLWGVIHIPAFNWKEPPSALKKLPKAVITTDCKSLYDLVSRLAMPTCEEYRTTLEVLLIKERCSEHCSFRWIPTSLMLADPLTKPMDPVVLRAALSKGVFQIYDEASVLRENAHRKRAVSWLTNK